MVWPPSARDRLGFFVGWVARSAPHLRVVGRDGLDLFDTLDRELPLNHALDRKGRRAAETGLPFERIRDLFSR